MNFRQYEIIYRKNETDDIFVLRLKPVDGKPLEHRLPGQFAVFKNPQYELPEQTHIFSFSSSPLQKEYGEFCVRVYGNWTHFLFENAKPGYTLLLSEPNGFFTWDQSVKRAVFLVGGIGISPVMGMLRTIAETPGNYDITLLYGSRTPETIAYKEELEELAKKINVIKIVHILSDVPETESLVGLQAGRQGYQGFVTPEIMKKEIDFSLQPNFFMTGPPPFLLKMEEALKKDFSIPQEKIKKEIISGMKLSS